MALQGLPVRFCIDRAGVVGGDGSVHHGVCDIALLRLMPEAALMAAIDEKSLRARRGQKIDHFVCEHNLAKWPRAFIDLMLSPCDGKLSAVDIREATLFFVGNNISPVCCGEYFLMKIALNHEGNEYEKTRAGGNMIII